MWPRLGVNLWRNLPNAITMARVVLAASFFVVLTPWRYDRSPLAQGQSPDWWLILAAALFLLAAASDALDGWLARRWSATTLFGRVMDPVADKLLIIGGFVYLAGPGFVAARFRQEDLWWTASVSGVQAWMVAVVLARELIVTSLRAVLEASGVEFPASLSGKIKMVLQSACIPGVLLLLNLHPWSDDGTPNTAGRAIQILVWTTIIATVWSGLPYIRRALDASPRRRAAPPGTLAPTAELLTTTLRLGHLNPFPGAWGALPTAALAGGLLALGAPPNGWTYNLVLLAVLVLFAGVCVVHGDAAEARYARRDPRQVVADETAGQAIPLMFLPPAAVASPGEALATLTLAFVAFRALDVLKPWPCRTLQRLPGGWGILLDDLAAGLYALVLVQAATRAPL